MNSTAQVRQVLGRMRKNVALACAPATNCTGATIGLTLWPPYPNATNAPAAGPGLPPAPGGYNAWGNGNMKPGAESSYLASVSPS
jgi:hypothetical protein|eukprot:COSAG06_NODE_797_length_12213_cov_7.037382_5_plen_85_part_00